MNDYGLDDGFIFSESEKDKLKEIKKFFKIFLKEINDRVDNQVIMLDSDNDYEFYFAFKDFQDEELIYISIGNFELDEKPLIEINGETYFETDNVIKLFDYISENYDEISEEIESKYEEYEENYREEIDYDDEDY